MLRERTTRRFRFLYFAFLVLFTTSPMARGDIYRWDNGQAIPGTEGIVAGLGVQLNDRPLECASLGYLDLHGANFSRSNLAYARFDNSMLSNADLSGANLANADFVYATLDEVDLTAIDARGGNYSDTRFSGFIVTRNAIGPDGLVIGLNLADGDELIVHDDDGVPDSWPFSRPTPRPPIPITVRDYLNMSNAGILRLIFESDPWDSLISFEPGISVTPGGTLKLTFAEEVEVASQVGRTLHVFDWTGVSPIGTFSVQSPYVWDLSRLYSSGEVTLLAIPEPTAVVLLLCGLCAFGLFASRIVR